MSSVHTLLVCCWRDGRGSNHRLQWTITLGLDALKCGTSVSREIQLCPTRSENCPKLAFLTWWCRQRSASNSLSKWRVYIWMGWEHSKRHLSYFFIFQVSVSCSWLPPKKLLNPVGGATGEPTGGPICSWVLKKMLKVGRKFENMNKVIIDNT